MIWAEPSEAYEMRLSIMSVSGQSVRFGAGCENEGFVYIYENQETGVQKLQLQNFNVRRE